VIAAETTLVAAAECADWTLQRIGRPLDLLHRGTAARQRLARPDQLGQKCSSCCPPSSGFEAEVGAFVDLPWPDSSFDAVVALHSFQFWPEPERSIREIARVLRRPSRLVLVLRDHSRRTPQWLPNPISRSGHELEVCTQLLRDAGLGVSRPPSSGGSAIVVATFDT